MVAYERWSQREVRQYFKNKTWARVDMEFIQLDFSRVNTVILYIERDNVV